MEAFFGYRRSRSSKTHSTAGSTNRWFSSQRNCFVVLVLVAIASSFASGQTTYYVKNGGNDNLSGLDDAHAWQSMYGNGSTTGVNHHVFQAGDVIRFNRGDTWHQRLIPYNGGTGEASRITFDAYGSGNRPIIDVTGRILDSDNPLLWTEAGSGFFGIYKMKHPVYPNPGRLWLNSVEKPCAYLTWTNIDEAHPWIWMAATQELFVYTGDGSNPAQKSMLIEGSDIGISPPIEISNELGNGQVKNYLTFQNLDIRGGSECVVIRGGGHITFDNCDISNKTSGCGILIQSAVNFPSVSSDAGVISHCNIDKHDYVMHDFEYGGGVTVLDGANRYGNGADNICVQSGDHWEIHDNYVAGMSHDGIGFNTTLDYTTHASFNKAYNNIIHGTNDYCRAFNVQGADGFNLPQSHGRWLAAMQCYRNEIYNNYVDNCTEQSQFQGRSNRFYNNVIENMRYSNWGGGSGLGSVYQCVGLSVSNDCGRPEARGGDSCIVEGNVFRNIPGPAIQIRCPHSFVVNNTCVNTGIGVPDKGIPASHIAINLWNHSDGTGTEELDSCTITSNTCLNGSNPAYVYWVDYNGTPPTARLTATEFNAADGRTDNLPDPVTQNLLYNNSDPTVLTNLATLNRSTLATATQNNSQRKLYRESSGKLSEVFESGGEVFYNDITSGSPTLTRWLSNSSGTNSAPSIAKTASAYVVAWQELIGNQYNINFTRSTNGGNTWSTPSVLASVTCPSPGPFPSTAGASTDAAFISYASSSGIQCQKSTDGGATWSAQMTLPGSSSVCNRPSTVVSLRSTWHIISQAQLAYASDSVGGAPTILHNYYDYEAGTFGSTPVNVCAIIPGYTLFKHANPCIAISADEGRGTVHVAWDALYPDFYPTGGRAIFYRKSFVGAFENQYTVLHNQGLVTPSITGLTSDNAYMVFQNAPTHGSRSIWKARYFWTGSYWGWQPFSPRAAEGIDPQISTGSSSARYIWTSGTSSPYQVNLSTETLSKLDIETPWVYLRAVNLIEPETGAFLSLELGDMKLCRSGGEVKAVSFQRTLADSGLVPTLSAVLDCGASEQLSGLLPTDTLELSYRFLSGHPERFQAKGDSARFSISLVNGPTSEQVATVAYASLGGSMDKAGGLIKARFPLMKVSSATLAATGATFSIRPAFSGISEKPGMIRSLGHIYQMLPSEIDLLAKEAATASTVPTVFELLPNYPNPFNPQTHIRYGLPNDAFISLVVYDILGREVTQLVDGYQKAGRYTAEWVPRGVATGVYFARLVAKDALGSVKYVKVDKLLLLK